jgi:ankyrin repeat protein
MDDLPPPPYEEHATPHPAARTQSTDLIEFEDDSIPHDEPPAFDGRQAHIVDEELPTFEDSTSHVSGAPYFALRPRPSSPLDYIVTHRIHIKLDSSPRNVKFPDPAKVWEDRGVNNYDWSTFLNHLFPIHSLEHTAKVSTYPEEKGKDVLRKPAPSSQGSSATLRSPAGASASQSTVQDLKSEVQRRLQIYGVLSEWNTHFFLPRGLLLAAKYDDSALQSKPLPIPEAEVQWGFNPIHKAISDYDIDTVRSLLQRGVDPNHGAHGAAPPLYVAVTTDYTEISKILLDSGANPDGKPSGAAPPIWHAALASNMELLSLLLRYGANLDGNSTGGPTALFLASERSDTPVMQVLLQHGASPIKSTSGTPTALYLAITRSDIEVINTLLPYMDKDGINKKVMGFGYPSCLHAAAANEALPRSIVQTLLQRGANPNDSPTGFPTALGDAATRGDVQTVEKLLEFNADVNKKPWGGVPTLWGAAAASHYDVVRLLIKHKVNVDDSPPGIPTALAGAIDRQDAEMVKLLLDAGADTNKKPMGGQSALHAAAGRGDIENVSLLMAKGADVNDTPPGTPTAMYQAIERRDQEMFRLLVEWPKTDMDRKVIGGSTALWYAASIGDVETVRTLLDKGELFCRFWGLSG